VSGEPGAEVASSVAAVAILNHLKKIEKIKPIDLQDALIHAHSNIIMGTTTALIVVIERSGSFMCASVGDSAMYSIDKDGKVATQIEQMRVVGPGSSIFRFMMLRNVVGSVLGTEGDLQIYFKQGTLDPGESLLLLSDGITDNLVIKTQEGNVSDCTGVEDLKSIIGHDREIGKIVTRIRKEIWRRMEDKVELKEKDKSLLIKPDDFAMIGFTLREKAPQKKKKSPKKKRS